MFSCVLVPTSEKPEATGHEEVLVAERVSLDVQVVSNAGRGKAECRYLLGKGYKDLLACVPAIPSFTRGVSAQQVKVTKCQLEVERDGCTPHTLPLQLTKLTSEYSDHAKSVPFYGSIKKTLKKSVSPEDLILHLGSFEAGTTLVLQFEFLLQLSMPPQSFPASSSRPLVYLLENTIPTKIFSYKMKLASHLQIVAISPTDSSTPLVNFNWFHVDQTKKVIQVSYETIQLHWTESTNFARAFNVEMGSQLQSACCSCLVQTNSRNARLSSKDKEYDGVMMLSSRITPEQLPVGVSTGHLFPSELVFLVDCSASMNPFIDNVIATLITTIKSLPEGCYFNLISFGSNFRQLFHESKEYSKSSVKNAVDFVNQLKASLGGTDLLPPLKWIYKTARKSDMPCQVFIITDVDQEVKDVPYMLSTIKKHRHHARCHTFGIGSSICESLVASIAEASGGRSIILQEGDRLQSKVMEVLKESLEPFLMETEIRWHPPRGYSVVDSTSKSLGTIYCHQTHLAFAFLKRSSSLWENDSDIAKTSSLATICSSLGDKKVTIPMKEAQLPSLSPTQTSELASILTQVGKWQKLEELEISRLRSISRKNSVEEGEEDSEPKAKRPRLNGNLASTLSLPSAGEIQGDLMKLSLESGIPCPFTYFRGTAAGGHEVVQALPYKQNAQSTNPLKAKNGLTLRQKKYNELRRQKQHRNGTGDQQHTSVAAAIAKSTMSVVGNSIMNFVNLFHSDVSMIEEGKTIDDELELQRHKGTQLYWDDSRGEIKYPSTYYQDGGNHRGRLSSGPTRHYHTTHRSNHKTSVGHSRTNHHRPTVNGHCNPAVIRTNTQTVPASSLSSSRPPVPTHRYVLDNSSSSDDEEEEFAISDSESDSSVELDWDSLPKTREYLPIIQMQLFGGAWPMIHEFSYAVRVPLGEIGKLPLLKKQSDSSTKPSSSSSSDPSPSIQPKSHLQDLDEEAAAHFWTTALAVVCFRECFPEFEQEWELIVHKGEDWIERNLDQCDLSMSEVRTMAKELLFRKS